MSRFEKGFMEKLAFLDNIRNTAGKAYSYVKDVFKEPETFDPYKGFYTGEHDDDFYVNGKRLRVRLNAAGLEPGEVKKRTDASWDYLMGNKNALDGAKWADGAHFRLSSIDDDGGFTWADHNLTSRGPIFRNEGGSNMTPLGRGFRAKSLSLNTKVK